MNAAKPTLKLFLSHGPYMDAELGVVRRLVREWNEQGASPSVVLLPDATLPGDVAQQLVQAAEVFVLLLADRWRASFSADGASRDCEQEYETARGLLDGAVRGDSGAMLSQLAVFSRDAAAHQASALQEQQVATFKAMTKGDSRVSWREFSSLEVLADEFRAWLNGVAELFGGADAGAVEGAEDALHEAVRLANAGLLARAEAAFMLSVAKADNVRAFIEYGKYLRRRGRASEAREMLERAVARAQATNDRRREADALANLALTLQTLGRLAEARDLHERALAIGEGVRDAASQAGALSGLSRIDKARGDLGRAFKLARRSLELSRGSNDLSGQAAQSANIGLLYRRCGEFEKAERWLRRALKLDEELGRDEAIARDLGNLALVHRAKGEHDVAERLLSRAAEINTRLGCLEGLANDYANLGQVFGERGNTSLARKYHEASRQLEEKLGRDEGLARSHHSLGLIAHSCGDLAGAERHWEAAAGLFVRAGLEKDAAQVRAMLSAMSAGFHPVMDAPAFLRRAAQGTARKS